MAIRKAEVRRAGAPPRDGLLRMAPFALRDPGTESDGNTLDGYAAVFNAITTIDSWEGRFKEQAAPGSMRKSFREDPPVIQFDHGHHPMVGSIPIARLESATEDTDPDLAPNGGAHVIGRLHDNWLVQPVRDAIASKAIHGMSFRFTVVRDAFQDKDGNPIAGDALRSLLRDTWQPDFPEKDLPLRTLQELRVPELGPVVFPAYDATSVGVRSRLRQAMPMPSLDPDEDPSALVASLDAVLDAAISYADASNPDSVAQCFALLTAAEEVCDALMEALGIMDPDDADPGRSAIVDAITRNFTVGHLARGARVAVNPDAKPKPGEASPSIRAAQARDRLLRLKGIVR
jgi:phage head maturation protease